MLSVLLSIHFMDKADIPFMLSAKGNTLQAKQSAEHIVFIVLMTIQFTLIFQKHNELHTPPPISKISFQTNVILHW